MRAILWSACALAMACGQKSGAQDMNAPGRDMLSRGSGSVSGTIGGQPFTVAAASFYSTSGVTNGANVQLSTDPGACSDQVNEVLRRGARDLFLQLKSLQPGSYAITLNAAQGLAYWRAVDASCAPANGDATSGTVIITRSDANAVEGSFDLTFDMFTYDMGSEHATGSFAAVPCPQTGMNPAVTCP